MADPKTGDHVKWNTAQGETTGKVVKKQNADTTIGEHKVSASNDDPQFIVESDKTGKKAAHKPDSLKKA